MNVRLTPHRIAILSVLAEGDITDLGGYATPILQKHTGHHTTNALSGVLQGMENEGLVIRDVGGRRTYRIGLTAEGHRVARSLNEPTPAPVIALPTPAAACDCDRLHAKIERLERIIANLSEALGARAAS